MIEMIDTGPGIPLSRLGRSSIRSSDQGRQGHRARAVPVAGHRRCARGRMRVESMPGRTRFRILLPAPGRRERAPRLVALARGRGLPSARRCWRARVAAGARPAVAARSAVRVAAARAARGVLAQMARRGLDPQLVARCCAAGGASARACAPAVGRTRRIASRCRRSAARRAARGGATLASRFGPGGTWTRSPSGERGRSPRTMPGSSARPTATCSLQLRIPPGGARRVGTAQRRALREPGTFEGHARVRGACCAGAAADAGVGVSRFASRGSAIGRPRSICARRCSTRGSRKRSPATASGPATSTPPTSATWPNTSSIASIWRSARPGTAGPSRKRTSRSATRRPARRAIGC